MKYLVSRPLIVTTLICIFTLFVVRAIPEIIWQTTVSFIMGMVNADWLAYASRKYKGP